MPRHDTDLPPGGVVLPFEKSDKPSPKTTSTTLAALLAVNVTHEDGVSAESRLIEAIEQSGDCEILDTEEVLLGLGFDPEENQPEPPQVANDNNPQS